MSSVPNAASAAAVPAIALEGAAFGWPTGIVTRDVSGAFEQGSLTAIVGPNGAGKSTLLKGIMGMLKPAHGRVVRCPGPAGEIAWLPQAADLDRQFPITVYDLVAMGAWRQVGPWGALRGRHLRLVDEALQAVGLTRCTHWLIEALSGGQMQRALFARMLLQDAPVLLMDEPFAAVDSETIDVLMALIRQWHNQGRTIIAVLHDLDLVREHFPRTLLLARRPIAWGDTATVLSDDNLRLARKSCDAAFWG